MMVFFPKCRYGVRWVSNGTEKSTIGPFSIASMKYGGIYERCDGEWLQPDSAISNAIGERSLLKRGAIKANLCKKKNEKI